MDHKTAIIISKVICIAATAECLEMAKTKMKPRRYWVRPFLRMRRLRGEFYVAVRKLDLQILLTNVNNL